MANPIITGTFLIIEMAKPTSSLPRVHYITDAPYVKRNCDILSITAVLKTRTRDLSRSIRESPV
jgi:hypothetical protein